MEVVGVYAFFRLAARVRFGSSRGVRVVTSAGRGGGGGGANGGPTEDGRARRDSGDGIVQGDKRAKQARQSRGNAKGEGLMRKSAGVSRSVAVIITVKSRSQMRQATGAPRMPRSVKCLGDLYM